MSPASYRNSLILRRLPITFLKRDNLWPMSTNAHRLCASTGDTRLGPVLWALGPRTSRFTDAQSSIEGTECTPRAGLLDWFPAASLQVCASVSRYSSFTCPREG